MLPWGVV